MLVLSGTRAQIFAAIEANPDAQEAQLKVKPGRLLLANLLGKTKVKTIFCSQGIRRTMPEKVLAALAGTGIEVKTIPLKRGRPFAIPNERVEKARSLMRKGYSVENAAKKAGISKRTLYYRMARTRQNI